MSQGAWDSNTSGRQVGPDAAGSPWSKGRVVLDDFLVEGALGEGGMGAVYLVQSRSSGQRFAVKRAKLQDPASQRNFLAELQTWIDLPDYPHLVACRFFRTVGDEVAIFAEYVEGGSLADWIRERKLTALPQMLDVAIQFAWGLAAAHELGLVHQDVKPGNVLLTPDGVAKVTDFGLARARAVAGEGAPAGRQSVLVSAGGMTPAYCSPEQAAGQRLSRQTDVWSWGLSVLEIFAGGLFWVAGQAAPEALESYLEGGPEDDSLPPMPVGVAALLRRCFQPDAARRPASMAEVAQDLQRSYRQAVGKSYPRQRPALPARRPRPPWLQRRRGLAGAQWRDPREWLAEALQAAGRDAAEAETLAPPRTGSRRAQAVADLAAFQEARRIFEELVAEGREDLRIQLAALCPEMALVHVTADDIPGALGLYGRAVEIWEVLVNQEGRRELADLLALAYENKAAALWSLRDHSAALALYDQAIEVCERLVKQEGRPELADDLANACLNKAVAVQALGDHGAAAAECDRAIEIWERLVNQEAQRESAGSLARAYLCKGDAVGNLGDQRASAALYGQAVDICERLVKREGQGDVADDLARAYGGKALALWGSGDHRPAAALYKQAIAIWERLVNQEGQREFADDLAKTYANQAIVAQALGDNQAAVAGYDRGIEIYERLVEREGRRDLAGQLAMAYTNKATAVAALGDNRGALTLHEQAVGIYERLVEQEGHQELAGDLARAYVGKAWAAYALGDYRSAAALYERAIGIYERLVGQEGRRQLADGLAAACLSGANALVALGDRRAAIGLYDRAIETYERLVAQDGRQELAGEAAWARAYRAVALAALGERERARSEGRQALAALQSEAKRTGRADLRAVLDWAKSALKGVV